MGFTFKENVPDIRNTRVIDIVRDLQEYGINVQVFDPMADVHEIKEEYNIDVFACEDQLQPAHAVLLAVPHQYFMDKDWSYITGLLKDKSGTVIDVKARLDRNKTPEGITLWRL